MDNDTKVHITTPIHITIWRQFNHCLSNVVGMIGALLLLPQDTWIPHVQTLLGEKHAKHGVYLIAISYLWQSLMKAKDVRSLQAKQKQATLIMPQSVDEKES